MVVVALPTIRLLTLASVADRFVVVAAEKTDEEAKKLLANKFCNVPVDAMRTLEVVMPRTSMLLISRLEDGVMEFVNEVQPVRP